MFLKKIAVIKDVGRFKDASISGGEYKKYTLFYAGNARGKTTLCAVLRSLQRNDPKFILERKNFKSTVTPEVTLILDSGVTKFSGEKWSDGQPNIHLFDQYFVNENVFSGDRVDLVHIPIHSGHPFQFNPVGDSDLIRSVIPTQINQ